MRPQGRRRCPTRSAPVPSLALAAAMALGGAAPLAGQQPSRIGTERPAAETLRQQLAAAFDGERLDALLTELARADSAGLPTRPLAHKALEGKSKGAPDARILQAVVAMRERLVVAADVLGPDRPEDVLVAAAGALYVGMDPQALGTIGARTRGDALGMALVVVGDLVRRGVDIAAAGRAVLALGAAGATADALNEFRRRVDRDISTGLTPDRATEVRMRGILTRLGGPGGVRESRP
ncbi:MAG: hypothetical protein GWM90_08820 [Gemmatimonadetes bacterium]|nr:hypothetical protein [Gemmatimonadota bacterium]NIQ53997.1 hypothetical protein [Gemmatimonadota bacterium]NIU74181.1 hypothetical protein [Gammaproteobacteria bacterium]NIX44212.1 hypothetical protein [Gemmatimonadota bacterium]NIY08443.1 hypothetical protein [Gemmatimonadota bacterium]